MRRDLTGLDVGEGQSQILRGDLQAYQVQPTREEGHDVDEATSALLWVIEVLTPYERRAHDVGHHTGTNRALAALAATSSAPLPVLRDD